MPDLIEIPSNKFEKKINEKTIKILFVGRDGVRKGLLEFVLALSKLNVDTNDIEVVIVSETDFDHSLLSKIKHQVFKSLSNVEVLKLMEDCQVFCLPTKEEAYGIVFVEAMSKGCAILADHDLPRLELIRDNQTGICVNPASVEDIKEGLKKLILDSEFRKKCMINAKNTYLGEFAPEVVAKKHELIFNQVINYSK
ncbi:glycosyltransferase family 4 protein [Picosynechococcus sp. PCC 7117]|uniref:glycosyltransferase family 4 protein n=1 Tax=Picosynechococcus sp. PCC 7117 TaxID=195498 RepID=UPI000810AC0E|nr:glycosyltransferase [Picosynechococcus sp. PCC 7117]ANV87359.1 hypothetical protein AWQ22_07765 [Picosynechococcus sp. PCC 7117]